MMRALIPFPLLLLALGGCATTNPLAATTQAVTTTPQVPLLVPSLTIPVNDLATDPQPLTTTPPPGPASTIDEGTYVVGVDIKPGTYRTGGPTRSTCYWFRLKDTSGELSAVIASDGTRGPATVTIKPSDRAFKTSGCMTWIKMD